MILNIEKDARIFCFLEEKHGAGGLLVYLPNVGVTVMITPAVLIVAGYG